MATFRLAYRSVVRHNLRGTDVSGGDLFSGRSSMSIAPHCVALLIHGGQYIVFQAASGGRAEVLARLFHFSGSRVAVGGQHSLTFHSWSIREVSARDAKEH